MLAIGDAAFLGLIKALDADRQLSPRPTAGLLRFEDAGSQEFRYILQFVGRQAQQELTGFAPLRVTNDSAQGFHQDRFHRR